MGGGAAVVGPVQGHGGRRPPAVGTHAPVLVCCLPDTSLVVGSDARPNSATRAPENIDHFSSQRFSCEVVRKKHVQGNLILELLLVSEIWRISTAFFQYTFESSE